MWWHNSSNGSKISIESYSKTKKLYCVATCGHIIERSPYQFPDQAILFASKNRNKYSTILGIKHIELRLKWSKSGIERFVRPLWQQFALTFLCDIFIMRCRIVRAFCSVNYCLDRYDRITSDWIWSQSLPKLPIHHINGIPISYFNVWKRCAYVPMYI